MYLAKAAVAVMKMQSASKQRVELRKTRRYVLQATARFWWGTPERVGEDGSGVTRDVSTAGAYVSSRFCPPVDARVHMDLLLPKIDDPAVGVRLHGEGTVLRVDRSDAGACGFAATLQFYPEVIEECVLSIDGLDKRS